MAPVLLVARAELRRSWRLLLVLGLLAGATGGVVIGSAQLARRTATAYERLERETGVPDAVVLAQGGLEQAAEVAALPSVHSAWTTVTGIGQVTGDAVRFLGINAGLDPPPGGLFTPIVLSGRPADPTAVDEMVITEGLAALSGMRVGAELELAFLTAAELTQFDTGFGEPDGPRLDMRIVGIVRVPIDQGTNAPEAFSTPAFARRIQSAGSDALATVFIRLANGSSVEAFEREADASLDGSALAAGGEEFTGLEIQVPARQRPVAAATSRVLTTGLVVFGVVAALAGIAAVALALRRHFHLTAQRDSDTFVTLGLQLRQLRVAWLLGSLPMPVVGVATGVALAAGLGVLNPIGSMRGREPNPGWHLNVLIVAGGGVLLAVALAAVALFAVAGRATSGGATDGASPSRVARHLARWGAPPAVVVGTRFAIEPGARPVAVPVRSALVGGAMAVAGIVAVAVFGANLDRLVSSPERWGWVADAVLADSGEDTALRLARDPRVREVSSVMQLQVEVEGRTTSADAFGNEKGDVGWTVLAGREPAQPGELLLGARLARDVGLTVGDRVAVRSAEGSDVFMDVVRVGVGPNLNNNQFGGDVVIDPGDIDRIGLTQPFTGAEVAFADGVDRAAITAELAAEHDLTTPQRPPDVDNLAQLGSLPNWLAAFLAALGVAVVAHLLATATRRRRRELDTLRALGLLRRQVRAAVVCASLVTAFVSLAIGVPLGVVAGRVAWRVTAQSAYVAGDAAVPAARLLAAVGGVFVVALLASAWPAWRSARRPIYASLRDE